MADPSPDISRRTFVRLGVAAAGAMGLGGSFAVISGCKDRKPKPGGGLGKRFEYDIKALSKTDPAMMGYRLSHNVSSSLTDSRAMQIDAAGTIWLYGGDAIVGLNDSGDVVRQFRTNGQPTCFTIDDSGVAFVGLTDHVEVYDADRSQGARWGIQGKPYLTSIAVHGEHVFVCDAGNRIVWRFDRDGTLINRIGDRDTSRGVEGFIVPSPLFDCAIDPTGELLWVANTGRHRMEAYSFDGEIQRTWGTAAMGIEGFCGCCNPCHFAMLGDGRFITSEKGLPRVKRYSAAGEFECVVAGCEQFGVQTDALKTNTPASKLGGPLVAVDGQQRVLVLHPAIGELAAYVEIGGEAA